MAFGLELDAPVHTYLGGLTFPDPRAGQITLRQLLSQPSGLSPERERPAFSPDPRTWEPYLGLYQSPQGPLTLRVQDGRLVGNLLGFDFGLEPCSPTEFVSSSDLPAFEGRQVRIELDPSGVLTLWMAEEPFARKEAPTP